MTINDGKNIRRTGYAVLGLVTSSSFVAMLGSMTVPIILSDGRLHRTGIIALSALWSTCIALWITEYIAAVSPCVRFEPDHMVVKNVFTVSRISYGDISDVTVDSGLRIHLADGRVVKSHAFKAEKISLHFDNGRSDAVRLELWRRRKDFEPGPTDVSLVNARSRTGIVLTAVSAVLWLTGGCLMLLA